MSNFRICLIPMRKLDILICNYQLIEVYQLITVNKSIFEGSSLDVDFYILDGTGNLSLHTGKILES